MEHDLKFSYCHSFPVQWKEGIVNGIVAHIFAGISVFTIIVIGCWIVDISIRMDTLIIETNVRTLILETA
jgi:hypothetical protein